MLFLGAVGDKGQQGIAGGEGPQGVQGRSGIVSQLFCQILYM